MDRVLSIAREPDSGVSPRPRVSADVSFHGGRYSFHLDATFDSQISIVEQIALIVRHLTGGGAPIA